MALNYIWIAFFLVGFAVALGKLIFTGNIQIFNDMVNAAFSNAKTGFEISLGLDRCTYTMDGASESGREGRCCCNSWQTHRSAV